MSTDVSNVLRLAEEIRDYIKDRAAVEKVGFKLPLKLFVEGVIRNAKIFGVHHDGRNMLMDEQEPHPGYFHDWTEKRTPTRRGPAGLDAVVL